MITEKKKTKSHFSSGVSFCAYVFYSFPYPTHFLLASCNWMTFPSHLHSTPSFRFFLLHRCMNGIGFLASLLCSFFFFFVLDKMFLFISIF
jgi:hypothetical protein